MKKIICILTTFLITITVVGCAGVGDYDIKLINGYTVGRSSAERIRIYPPEDTSEGIRVPTIENYEDGEYIKQVGHDNKRYIVAKTNHNLYYIIDTKKTTLYGPLDKDEFIEKKNDLNMSSNVKLQNLEDYTRDYGWTVQEAE